MSQERQRQPVEEGVRIPLSVVLMTAGTIILLTAGFIYALLPVAPPGLPALIPLARVPTAAATARPLPTLLPSANDGDVPPILLPETPLEWSPAAGGVRPARLPSEARADQAPREFRVPLPGQPVRLSIPALGLDVEVEEVGLEPFAAGDEVFYSWRVPSRYAAGWHSDSALLGKRGNTVLNGHHNIYGAVFGDLIDLEVGAEIILYDREKAHHYRVLQKELLPEKGEPLWVRRANANWTERKRDERITLVTCWPRTDNSHRLVVVAVPAAETR